MLILLAADAPAASEASGKLEDGRKEVPRDRRWCASRGAPAPVVTVRGGCTAERRVNEQRLERLGEDSRRRWSLRVDLEAGSRLGAREKRGGDQVAGGGQNGRMGHPP